MAERLADVLSGIWIDAIAKFGLNVDHTHTLLPEKGQFNSESI
jgi:hypothetical protein